MSDEASSSLHSRREFLKSASLLAVAGYALPGTALASTPAMPRASWPADLLEEFGYGDVQLAPIEGFSRYQALRQRPDALVTGMQ